LTGLTGFTRLVGCRNPVNPVKKEFVFNQKPLITAMSGFSFPGPSRKDK
jgi:hypothetical protein